MALLDTIGVASILPFMTVLSNPSTIHSNHYLSYVYTTLEFTSPESFLFFLGISVLTTLLFSIMFRAITTYAQLRFTMMQEYSLGRQLVSGYLQQPYEWFLNRHSSDIGKTVLSEVSQVISSCITPMMQAVAQISVIVALMTLLIATNPTLSLMVSVILIFAYGTIYGSLRKYLGRIGADRVAANQERYRAVAEAFGGIKDVKITGQEKTFLSRFEIPARRFASHQATASIIGQLPRFLLEAIAFGGMIVLVLYLMSTGKEFQSILPVLTLYAFAAYRLLPALQIMYQNITALRFSSTALDVLYDDMKSHAEIKKNKNVSTHSLEVKDKISLENITYAYPGIKQPAINNLDLTIAAHSIVGLVGTTGSGKTTTIDLLLGLLHPQHGNLKVDDTIIIDDNVREWQKIIGYVPQHIYLTDDTVTANIAFGVAKEEINQSAILRAARIANLHEFVIGELPKGYDTDIGERGVRLSGGQRQRIGIARALYHNPQVLILDEATSALDNLTEKAVMEAIHNLGHEITIILIAHRLSTVRDCDVIYFLEKGQIRSQGSFEELLAQSKDFRNMVGVPKTDVAESIIE
ncbi:ABC transporter ATP-binding protein [Thalassospira mesophila]|uniref:ABC transporter ATP-binding protein n=1 Tax=Thalassospira mesophila TaxID=1293891 RepID=UPI001B804C0A|nr:ABC transporter ATP-binding protein [Thalassospira mesophila]